MNDALQECLDGATLMALQLVGFTDEEWTWLNGVYKVLRHARGYTIVWHNRPARTIGKYFYIVGPETPSPIEFVQRQPRVAKSEHYLVVLVDGRVPFGTEIKPEWREQSCLTKS